MYIEGEVPYVSGNGNNNGNNGWNDWSWIIGLALVGGLFGGWGNGGFGFGGGRGGAGNCATQADLAAGFSTSTLQRGIDDILLNQANNLNFINQGFAGLNTQLLTGFHGVDNAICTLGYQNQMGFNNLGTQLADCCCKLERGIDSVNFHAQRNTCDIIRASQDNTRAILDYLTSEKISSLQAENSGLKAQISNDRQTRTIIDEIKPCPIPAYITCNPYQSAYGFPYGNNNGCGGCNNF